MDTIKHNVVQSNNVYDQIASVLYGKQGAIFIPKMRKEQIQMPAWFEGFLVCCGYVAVACAILAVLELTHRVWLRWLYKVLVFIERRVSR